MATSEWRVVIVMAILASNLHLSTENERQKRSVGDTQPKIITQNGHLVFQTGVNHNITFKSNSQGGGYINIDGENFKAIAQMVKDNYQKIEQVTQTQGSLDISNRLNTIENRLENLQPSGEVQRQLNELTTKVTDLTTRISDLEVLPETTGSPGEAGGSDERTNIKLRDLKRRVTALLTPTTTPRPRGGTVTGSQFRRMRTRVRTLESQVRDLRNLLTTNECLSNPCRHGGTCVDTYNGYICKCSQQWEGPNCDSDVNECARYAGTDMGCQNGASCINTPGGFRCQCAPNWYGIRCTESHNDCSGNNQALCGHGTCVNAPRTQAGQAKYTCICDQGWKTDGTDPACDVDVDECSHPHPPCSHDPPVQCINVPGTYFCGVCPLGFSGNGFVCVDINECEVNNGGCSQAPRVECINTKGSYRCESCPQGYQGDGRSCQWVGVCSVNNGGCHSQAQCAESPGIGGRVCRCPTGYVGNGEGANGCVQQGPGGATCSAANCMNGQCQSTPTGLFHCLCNPGYTGAQCQTDINECDSNPCLNGGTCVDRINQYLCQCSSSFTGTNCEQAQQSCGGRLAGETGSFKYPPVEGQPYPHSVSCAWVVTTTPGKIIMASFTRFKTEPSRSCDYDFVQMNDGASAASHAIGKFCGTSLPNSGNPINSTHNQLYFWFRSDASQAAEGFQVQWTSAAPVCGGDLAEAGYGVINSPGYPGVYPHSRDCVWTVRVAPGNKIRFSFAKLAIERHANCSFDFLEIRDGLLDTDPVLKKYCNSTSPRPLDTTGPYAWLMFHSDDDINDVGFHITYSSLPVSGGCGGAFTDATGVLTSPGYPNPYPRDASCVWTITIPDASAINFRFTALNIETHGNCDWDYVEVRDGGDETAPAIGRVCGDTLPPPIVTTQNQLWVKFRSDPSNTRPGFRAEWSRACGGTFTDPTGDITSPHHPAPYPSGSSCSYLITMPPGRRVILMKHTFDLESSATCQHDYLKIFDGADDSSTVIGQYCGTNIPSYIPSSGSSLLLKFKSNGSVQRSGFALVYTVDDSGQGGEGGGTETNAGCGGTMTAESGTFTSPGYPNQYPHGMQCVWTILANPGSVVRLTFHSFSLEQNANCRYDYVRVSDNSTVTNTGGFLGRYCGGTVPPALTSADNIMRIEMSSDGSTAHQGFSASYVTLNASTTCGGEMRNPTGVISSPNYPNPYPHNRQCIWVITVPAGRQILLNFTDFQTESHAHCLFDYLEVRNGGYLSSPRLGTYCGTTVDNPIRSTGNRLYIKFRSDQSSSGKGFRLTYDGTVSGCGGDLTAPSGSITSPNYPLAYHHFAQCFWTIRVAEGSNIQMMFVDFNLEARSNCQYDYLQVHEEGPYGRKIGQFCGPRLPAPITSKTNQLWLKFYSDVNNNRRGFHLAYQASCNNHLTGYRGVIESPSFPNPYPGDMDCTWTIETTLGNNISISFSHFDTEQHTDCRFDYLEIRDGRDGLAPLLGHWCGGNLPRPLQSSSNVLWINFKSDAAVAGSGFRLEWVTLGCGGDLTGPSGALQSPNYPEPYPRRRECAWTVTAEAGEGITLNIDDFDLESINNCYYDALEIFSGTDDTGPQLAKLCHRQNKPQMISTNGNHMFLRFRSDSSRQGKGFHATYSTHLGGCGGNFSAPTGVLMSKNYPQDYPANTECEWTIMGDDGHTIELTILDFDMEKSKNCIYDYVKVYDGVDENSQVLMHHCGHALPNETTIISTGGQMFIRMRSDSSVHGHGFKASYARGCGARLDADTDGEITSPNYPHLYSSETNCSWIIEASNPTDHVTLTFTHMDISDKDSCVQSSIKVADGNDEYAPTIGTYCGFTVPPAITSQGSALHVSFTSGSERRMTGFRATYTKSTSACGGVFTSEHGAFNSPAYPNSYPSDTECVWQINSSPGNNVLLTFSLFDLESDPFCNLDYVEVREGDNRGALFGRFCGSEISTNMTLGHSLWVKFRSSSRTSGQGFMAQYASVYGGEISGTSGQLSSPLYPLPYPSYRTYTWTISVDLQSRVRITFITMDLIGSGVRCFDYVQFLDGATEDSPEIGKYCMGSLPEPLTSSGNQLSVKFHSDYNWAGNQGFLLRWERTSAVPVTPTTPGPSTSPVPGCGGDLVALESPQQFTSPGFPYGYDHNSDCMWLIRAPADQRVAVNATYMDLEAHTFCRYDNVLMYDGDSADDPNNIIDKLCGKTLNSDLIVSSSNTMLVRFTTDHSMNKTGFAMDYMSVCGGKMTDPVGVMKSPGFPGNNYPDNANCSWTIEIKNGRTISLVAETFDLQNSTDCPDYVEFLNGGHPDSPPLGDGRYCDSSKVSTLPASSSNHIMVNFISDDSQSGRGFRIIYREVPVACGGHLTLTDLVSEGYIQSPNYPSDYPANVDCVWVISAPTTETLQLDFDKELAIEAHPGCEYDYVEVRDGGTENSARLGRYCGTTVPGTITSTGNILYVRFRTDNLLPKKGFRAKYKIAICGGTIRASSGSIKSPNYPATYPNNLDCDWLIYGPTGHFLTLTFDAFSLEYSSNCTDVGKDSLVIRDLNATGPVIRELCGTRSRVPPSPILTSDSFAFIKFTTDNRLAGTGFKLNFEASVEECGGELTTPTGVFTSPNYPGQYPHSRICIWKITVPQGRRVKIEFPDFSTEHHSGCHYDRVGVYDGVSDEAPVIKFLCGDSAEPVQSSSNTMKVTFWTDGSVSSGGFRASYSSAEESVCGGMLTAPSGFIASPNFDMGYYNDSQLCTWVISNPQHQNSSVALRFKDFALEEHRFCAFDFLELREGSDETGRLIGRFCGNTSTHHMFPPHRMASPTSNLWIQFRADRSVVDAGFNFTYEFTNCGGILTSPGVVTSPNYPNNYDHHDSCAWLIQAPEGSQVKLEVEDLDIEAHSNCIYDYLEIFNGGAASSPSIGKFCGDQTPKAITSMSNALRVEFHTDSADGARGFRIKYSFVSGGCGALLHSPSGVVSSPQYPGRYPPNTECEWEINVETGYHVNITFQAPFDIAQSHNCSDDYVQLLDYQRDDSEVSLGRFCSSNRPPSYKSTSHKMKIKFHSDATVTGNGFAANWTSGCGALFTDKTGRIMSPGHPGLYGNNLDCVYTISVDPEHFIVLKFEPERFSLEAWNCIWDYVEVHEGNSTAGKSLGKFCGKTAPQMLYSLGSMTIIFHSDKSYQDTGFEAIYWASACGGRFTKPGGRIHTPTYPVKYHHNANCIWYLEVESDRVIELKFNEFELEGHSRCKWDFVAVYDGPDSSYPLIGRFCGVVNPGILRSSNNTMTINFVTDASVSKDGFTASYRTTFGPAQGCGGLLNGTSGRFGSVDYDLDGAYEADLNCVWQIMVEENQVVKLHYENMVLETDSDCDYDYVEVRDGLFENSPLVGKYCYDGTTPDDFTASSNFLRVRFFSDSSVNMAGFNASFSQAEAKCGGVRYANSTPSTLTSPDYPNDYPHNSRCRWVIDAPANEQVYVVLEDVALEGNIACAYDYLELRDNPLGPLGQSHHFCGDTQITSFISVGRSFILNFVTDDNSANRGFSLTYEIASCNRNYTRPNGRILSPNWPQSYPSGSNCSMLITVPEGSTISLFFNEFALERHEKCRYDYLKVYNGSDALAPVITQACGRNIPDPIFSSGNSLFLEFMTDNSLTMKGFDITYTSSPNGCGGNLTGINGTFTSPGYPNGFPVHTMCVWYIQVPYRRLVHLEFSDFNLDPDCAVAYVEAKSARHCGVSPPAAIVSVSNVLTVKFRSVPLSVSQGTGFSARYWS